MTRKTKAFWVSVILGAVLAVAVAEENWLMAAIIGAILMATLWVFVHAFPRDLAPPQLEITPRGPAHITMIARPLVGKVLLPGQLDADRVCYWHGDAF